MTKASDNAFPSILITEGTEPSAPAAGKQRLYIDSTSHLLMVTNSSGTESAVGSGVGGIAATIVDVKGDIIVATAADTVARKAAGANGTILTAQSGQSDGLLWSAPPTGARYIRTSGDYTTTSATFVDVDGTNMALTITTLARRVMVGFVGSVYVTGATGKIALTVAVDAADQGDATFGLVYLDQHATASEQMNGSFTYMTDVLSAGSHTFKLRFNRQTAGTATISGSQPQCEFWVAETMIVA